MDVSRVTAPAVSTTKQFFTGVGLLLRGMKLYVRSPGMMLLGIIPALISSLLFIGAFVTLVYFVGDLAEWVTPFADDWSEGVRSTTRLVVAIAFLAVGGLLTVLTFTAVTLLIGDPFYEKISEMVEDRFGGVPNEVEVPWWRSLGRSIVDSLRLVGLSILIGLPLFLGGFIPLVGQIVIPVIAAVFGGWILALELVAVPFQRRGQQLAGRREVLRTNRPMALGFGVAVFCCFLVPLGAVLIMPAAVAGGTLLARRSLGLSIEETPSVTVRA
ncbi:EI24 domain-containing protein [Micromonospora sonneratiae]|uniref:EI24 domain-containing protein n=1 Tax=Micromonospora sonneratiae TaxID=1184706 RepID=A0ABW3YLU8_9ACTN